MSDWLESFTVNVISNSAVERAICDFLLVSNSSYNRINHRLGVTAACYDRTKILDSNFHPWDDFSQNHIIKSRTSLTLKGQSQGHSDFHALILVKQHI